MFNKIFNSGPKSPENQENTFLSKEDIAKKVRNFVYGSMLVGSFLSSCKENYPQKENNIYPTEQNDSTMTKSQFMELEKLDNSLDSLAGKFFEEVQEKKLVDSITHKEWKDLNGKVTNREDVYHYKNWSFSGTSKETRDPFKMKDAQFDITWSSNEKKGSFRKEGYEYSVSGSQNTFPKIEPVKSQGQILHYTNPQMTKEGASFSDYFYVFNEKNGGTLSEHNFASADTTKDEYKKENSSESYNKITSAFNMMKDKIQEELKLIEKK